MRKSTKTTYKTFKQSFYSSNSFRVIFALNVKTEPKSRNKNWVLAKK